MGPASGVKKDSLILNENSKYPRTSSAEKELDLIQLLHILFLQWKIILCITIAFTLAASLYTFLSPTVYQADALIQVEQKQNQAFLNRLKNILLTDTSAVSAEIELLKSRMILGKTVDDLNLRIQSEQIYFPVTGYLWAKLKGESSAEITIQDLSLPQTNDQNSEVILTVQEKGLFHLQGTNFSLEGKVGERLKKENIIIEVSNIHAVPGSRFKLRKISKLEAISNLQLQIDVSQQGKESGMIALRITGHNPNEIARILDTVMNNYVQQNINRQAARDANSLAFLQRQLPKVQSELDDAESKLNVYRQQQDSVDLNLEAKTVLEQMVNVENQLNALTFREAEISQLYKKSHPAYRALLDKRQTLVQEKDKLNQRISAMPSTQQEVLKLSRDVETGREIYLQLLSRQQELNISRSSNVGNVRIIDPAVTWPSPVKPKKALIIMLGTMLGLISSSGLAIARVALRRGIESSETLENAGVHVLATVPVSKSLEKKYRHQQRSSIVNFFRRDTSPRFCLAFEEPADISIEAVRGLRTTLHFIMKETPNRVLMISGATMGCGKTFISSSLAAVIAQSGQRV
ncbi:MAG: GNVR domain-containing protein, partial [Acinetobacter sp.]